MRNLYLGKDVLAVLPTGFGKSRIYQGFSLLKSCENTGATLIIIAPLSKFSWPTYAREAFDIFLSIRCKNKKLDDTMCLKQTYSFLYGSYSNLCRNRTKTIVNRLYLTHLAIVFTKKPVPASRVTQCKKKAILTV